TAQTIILATGAIGLIVAIVFGMLLTRRIVGPLNGIAAAATQIAQGDLTVAPPRVTEGDEIAQVTSAVATMTTTLREFVRKAQQVGATLGANSEALAQSSAEAAAASRQVAESMKQMA